MNPATAGNAWYTVHVETARGVASIRSTGGKAHLDIEGFTWGYKAVEAGTVLATDGRYRREVRTFPREGVLGKGTTIEVACTGASPLLDMLLRVSLLDEAPAAIIELVLAGTPGHETRVTEITPVLATGRDGSVARFGEDPSRLRVLEAGLAGALDLNVRCVAGDEESDSNGNVLIHDPATGGSVLAGVIDRPDGVVEIIANENRPGEWKVVKTHVPWKRVHPARAIGSTPVIIDIDGGASPFEVLERYASRLAAVLGVRPWPRDRPVPHGWNSWGNPADTDPRDASGHNAAVLVHDLTEETVRVNLEAAVNKLGKFGVGWFQIDDGYQQAHGDWEPDPGRFPRGLKPVFDEIRAKGLRPGAWIRPFELSVGSKTYRDHPDWGLGWEDSFPMKSKTHLPLDVSNPAARRWLRDTFTRMARHLGLAWIKTDFTYNIIGGKGFADPDMTSIEAMQEGFKVIREAIGPDVFLAGIGGPCMFHYGLVDAERVTLDVQPAWGKDGEMMPVEQGIKPNARVIARRYYLHDRIWLTHCDVLQFRPPLCLEESMVQASVIGLSGGVFKVGEQFTNLAPEHVRVVAALLPIYRPRGRGMRPLDLLEKEYPETWDLLVDDAGNGLGEYHLVGLFNWGENAIRGKPVPETPREVALDFRAAGIPAGVSCHVFEFWTGTYKGCFEDRYAPVVDPRRVELVSVRPATGNPQLLASGRHVTQGATDILATSWDAATGTLAIEAMPVPDHDNTYHVFVPPGLVVIEARAAGCEVSRVARGNGHVTITLRGARAIRTRIDVVLALGQGKA